MFINDVFKLCNLAYNSREYISSLQELLQGIVHTHQTPQQWKVLTSLKTPTVMLHSLTVPGILSALHPTKLGMMSTGQTYIQK